MRDPVNTAGIFPESPGITMIVNLFHNWFKKCIAAIAIIIASNIVMFSGHAQLYDGAYNNYNYNAETINIKSINGKFYAYIVLLFNENPHFVNMIQKDNIPLKIMGNEGFHIKEYKNYLNTLRDKKLKNLANILLMIYDKRNIFLLQLYE